MRKLLLLTFVFVIGSFMSSNAQGFKLGITTSPSFNWYAPTEAVVTNEGLHTGFNYGLMFDYFFLDNYGVHMALTHSFVGGNISISDTAVNSPNIAQRVQQIEIPVALKLTTKEMGLIKVYGAMGVNFGFAFGGNADFAFSPADSVYVNMNDVNIMKDNGVFDADDYKSAIINTGIHIGAGVHYYLRDAGEIVAGVYFNNGFLNVNRTSEYKATPKNLGIRLGFYF